MEQSPQHQRLRPYKKDFDISYTLGAFPTIELLRARPNSARQILIHPNYREADALRHLCASCGVPCYEDPKSIQRLGGKESCLCVGVFEKFDCTLNGNAPHLLLDNPGDMGNLGTIIRSMAGFGIRDLAIIRPGADIFHPKTVRASMGALFRIRHHYFPSLEQYRAAYPSHRLFPFMLDGEHSLNLYDHNGLQELLSSAPYTLAFGNESSGLPAYYRDVGQSVFIPQSSDVDSLNLTIAAGIGLYVFTQAAQALNQSDRKD